MWGNIGNFTDLAKAAQELQEQAASSMKQTPSFSPPFSGVTGGFFNMDALQQQSDSDEIKNKSQKQKQKLSQSQSSPPQPQPIPSRNIQSLQSLTLPAVPAPKPPTKIKGKLKIPQTAPANTNSNTNVDVAVQSSIFATPLPPPKETQILSSNVEVLKFPSYDPPSLENANEHQTSELSANANDSPTIEKSTLEETMEEEANTSPTEEKLVSTEASAPAETVIVTHDDGLLIPPDDQIQSLPTEEVLTEDPYTLPSDPVSSPKESNTVMVSNMHEPNESLPEAAVPVTEMTPSTLVPDPSSEPQQQSTQQQHRDGITPAKPPPSIPEHFMEQFSSQLQRLEENHQMEQQAMQQQHQQQVQKLSNQLKLLKEELSKLHGEKNRQKESLTLQLDSLKHELEGTQKMLQDKSKEERKMQDAHLKQLRQMEKKMVEREKDNENLRKELQEREKIVEEGKGELQVSRDEYATLKERVMVVAGELKERRMECRTLQSEVDLLQNTSYELNDKITHLEAQGMDLNKSSKETSTELNYLRGQLMDKEKELQEVRGVIAVEAKKGEDALAAYKKKAQQSLSVTNSRTAAAVQAKEEAEMEARAARSAADSAMERAAAAERKGNEALAEAKAYVHDMEQQVAKLDTIKWQLDDATTKLERVQLDAKTAQEANEKLVCELQSLQGRYEAEKITNNDLRKELLEVNSRSAELFDEVERLRREGQRLKDELKRAAKEAKEEIAATGAKNGSIAVEMVPARRTTEAETTIAMLQQELQDANNAIRELKETLKATVEEQARSQPNQNGDNHESTGGMPLFYAMEKQAELTQARNEIARLANLLGDSEASKQDAMDAMESMRHQLHEIQAKLELESRRSTPQEERVNLEYLKNVILSFLNAKSQLEKKTLLPVIGTVLCLTSQEQQQAMQQLEKEGKLSLDSVTSSVMNLRWS